MRIPESKISEIVDVTDIVQLVSEYVSLTLRNNRFWGNCPFHQEKTPSFTVSPEKSSFYCFGCGKGGGLIQFVMDIEQFTFLDSVMLLADRAGIKIETKNKEAKGPSRSDLIELNSRIAETFHYLLLKSKEASKAQEYLQERCFSLDAISTFKIGWAPSNSDWLIEFLRSKDFSDDFLLLSGLFTKSRTNLKVLRPLFYGRLMFPIFNVRREVIAFGGRSLDSIMPKYINSPETMLFQKQKVFFGLNYALSKLKDNKLNISVNERKMELLGLPAIYVVEGYTDVIALHSINIPAVAVLGTAFGSHHARVLNRYDVSVVLMYDADEAGRRATIRSLEELAKEDIPAGVVALPSEKDPADFIAADQLEELQRRAESPITASQYIIQNALKGEDLSSVEGKEQVFRKLFPYIKNVGSAIVKDAILHELAIPLRLNRNVINEEFYRLNSAEIRRKDTKASVLYRNRREESEKNNQIDRITSNQGNKTGSELKLMLAVAVNMQYFEEVRKHLICDELEDEQARELYIAIETCYRYQENNTENLLQRVQSSRLASLVAEKLSVDEFSVKPEVYIREGVRYLKSRSIQRKRDHILEKVRRAEHSGAMDSVIKLLEDKMSLDNELEKLKLDNKGR